MVDTLIFDFGDVFINLDKEGAMVNALKLFELQAFEDDMLQTNINYEIGAISTENFISFYLSKFPELTRRDIIDAWNFILKDFPEYRFQFIKNLRSENRFKTILLSNTNEMHITFIKQQIPFYDDFRSCFDAFYLSHEIQLRKPNKAIYQYVLNKNQLSSAQCLFIDDTEENTRAAEELGFNVWNIDETKEDIVDIFKIKNELF